MNCADLFGALGFSCRKFSTGTLAVGTPFSFADGDVIHFYLDEFGSSVRIRDNSDTLFHLSTVGLDVTDRKKWRFFRQLAEAHGLQLEDSGELLGRAEIADLPDLVKRYVGTLLKVADYEREQRGMSDEAGQFLAEVEFYLRAWHIDRNIVAHPQIIGLSGRIHTFDFEYGDELVDAIRPNSNSTGSILRKAMDLADDENASRILVVMDDREDVERASAETAILSRMVSVVGMQQLQRVAGQPPSEH
ncbi:DUF1828 domain-containing protein [Burkholderia pseudomallei]|uniref:DUF1828 domain-containing protein n=1 Tax=Burkholderia pseudomallei TaxID=28450 RepID=UPI0018C635BA|nr:DUF1828 domain-containing protein [Burkholderia pseudomallei]MBG1251940.1 DUF1828 domain-containing protein [Burkholderia pseudomallei]